MLLSGLKSIFSRSGLEVDNPHSLPTEDDIRMRCEASVRRTLPAVPLKTVHVVGGVDCEIGGQGRDSEVLTKSIQYLLESGVAIDPDFQLTVFNFLYDGKDAPNLRGEDYLSVKDKADIVISAYMRGKNIGNAVRKDVEQRRSVLRDWDVEEGSALSLRQKNQFYDVISPKHTSRRWFARMKQADAKIIVTFGGCREVSTRWFNGNPFCAVLETPNIQVLDTQRKFLDHFNWFGSDIPMKGLGIVADRQYLALMSSSLNTETCFGRKAQNIVKSMDVSADVIQTSPGGV